LCWNALLPTCRNMAGRKAYAELLNFLWRRYEGYSFASFNMPLDMTVD
jgi:hypothetical protein